MEHVMDAKILAARFAFGREGGTRCGLPLAAVRTGHQNLVLFYRQHSMAMRVADRPQRPAIFPAGSGTLSGSVTRGGAVGATLLGLTSVLPTKDTPSSMTSFVARMSPNSSVLVLISIFSLALMLPLILPRTTAHWALMLPLMTAVSPRVSTPSVWISPSSLPSKVSSPENLRLPL